MNADYRNTRDSHCPTTCIQLRLWASASGNISGVYEEQAEAHNVFGLQGYGLDSREGSLPRPVARHRGCREKRERLTRRVPMLGDSTTEDSSTPDQLPPWNCRY